MQSAAGALDGAEVAGGYLKVDLNAKGKSDSGGRGGFRGGRGGGYGGGRSGGRGDYGGRSGEFIAFYAVMCSGSSPHF